MLKVKPFGQRFCTYCGTNEMYYFIDEEEPIGVCLKCNNIDYCDNETVEQVKERFGEHMKTPDLDTITFTNI
jgi:hypothetical protein